MWHGLMEKNIFDEASKKFSQRRREMSPSKRSEAPLDPSAQSAQTNSQHSQDEGSNAEVEQMLKKMEQMKNDFDNQLKNLYDLGRRANVDVDSYLTNTNKLTRAELEALKEQERILKEKFNAAKLPGSCLEKQEKTKDQLTQERKGKFRGSRQKWIPVQ